MINVSTGEFYGPFDLLLDLIKKSKYDIYDIKLSNITNEYIESMNKLDIPANETADFVVIATQLLYIKTKTLIDDSSMDYDEEDLVSEDELINRLIEYKKIKSIIPYLRDLENDGLKKHYKFQEDLSKYSHKNEEIIKYDVSELKKQIENIINLLLEVDEFKVDSILNIEEYSLEKYNIDIKLKLIKDKIISITNMLKKVKNKSEAIIIFLSILELSKNKTLVISQDYETLDIIVKLNEDINE